MISAGMSCLHCSYPVNLNTYTGCSHDCKYCYASRFKDISKIKPLNCEQAVKNFIAGKRSRLLSMYDWKIPLHIGTSCDPLQPCEEKYRATLRVLRVLYKTGYPYILTTKGKLAAEEPYISLFEKSSCVIQISMACSDYDVYEQGCPSFDERLEMVKKLSDRGVRVVCRAEPFIVTYKDKILERIKDVAEAGAYAIKCGGYFAKSPHPGMIYDGGDYMYPVDLLAKCYFEIREECHKYGLKFYCQEEFLNGRLSDETVCCGTCGLNDSKFRPNTFTTVNLLNGENVSPTPGMKKLGTAEVFRASSQTSEVGNTLKKMSYEDYVRTEVQKCINDYKKCDEVIKEMLENEENKRRKNNDINASRNVSNGEDINTF